VRGRKRQPSPGPYLMDVELRPDRIPDARAFPYCLPSIRGLETNLPFHPKVTFFVGENGFTRLLFSTVGMTSSLTEIQTKRSRRNFLRRVVKTSRCRKAS
jgi:predicted ATPase